VVSNNNFGDGKLLLELNKIVVDKQRMFTLTDMCIMLSGLAEIDRVTDSSLQMFTTYFKNLKFALTKQSVTSLVRASWTFI
jgi:hypothetical protein